MSDLHSVTPSADSEFQAHGLTGIPLLVAAVLLTAMAAGTGWGIRGQYGHETGAMIAGTLASLTLVLLFVPNSMSLTGMRAAAMMAIAIGVGGSMTYGQTVGLTHDREVVSNLAAWRWGMLGLALKGGVWIGFGGLFLGMGLGGTRYRPIEITLLLAGAIALFFIGIWLVNSPYDPGNKQLPFLYFSDHWQFEPERWEEGLIKPRYETFGGYWAALIGLALYVRVIRGDRLALRMAAFGVLGGAMGFPGGQCIQSAHAWRPEWFREGGRFGFGEALFRTFNWWNVMETTFGAIWGAVVGLGLWLNRRLISVGDTNDSTLLPAPVEVVLAVVYASFVLAGEFEYLNPQNLPIHTLDFLQTHPFEFVSYWYIEIGIVIVSLPLIGISGGRLSPYVAILLLIPMTICGKTLRAVGYTADDTSVWFQNYGLAWYMLVQVPLAIGLVVAAWQIQKAREHSTARAAGVSLLIMSGVYFCLNSAFFGFPDVLEPMEQWGGRHANQAFFLLSTMCLMLTSVISLLVFPGCFQCAETRQPADG